jgi:predicted nucleic acid-binding protein
MIRVGEAYVVDTGVFVRWYIEQIGFEHALEVQENFMGGKIVLETVDSVRFELGHLLRTKGLLPKLIERDEYLAAVRSLDDLGILIHTTDANALERAASLAATRNLRFFDAIVVDLSLERGLPLLTTDKKLCTAVSGYCRTELLRGI